MHSNTQKTINGAIEMGSRTTQSVAGKSGASRGNKTLAAKHDPVRTERKKSAGKVGKVKRDSRKNPQPFDVFADKAGVFQVVRVTQRRVYFNFWLKFGKKWESFNNPSVYDRSYFSLEVRSMSVEYAAP